MADAGEQLCIEGKSGIAQEGVKKHERWETLRVEFHFPALRKFRRQRKGVSGEKGF